MVSPGGIIDVSSGVSATLSVCAARKASSRSASAGSVVARIAAASSAGVGRARLADGQRADGNAGGHLDDREQAVLP